MTSVITRELPNPCVRRALLKVGSEVRQKAFRREQCDGGVGVRESQGSSRQYMLSRNVLSWSADDITRGYFGNTEGSYMSVWSDGRSLARNGRLLMWSR